MATCLQAGKVGMIVDTKEGIGSEFLVVFRNI
jgi:hypothetical protein